MNIDLRDLKISTDLTMKIDIIQVLNIIDHRLRLSGKHPSANPKLWILKVSPRLWNVIFKKIASTGRWTWYYGSKDSFVEFMGFHFKVEETKYEYDLRKVYKKPYYKIF